MEVKTVELPQCLLPKEKITFEEFLAWCDEDTWAEWVDGEVIMVSPASMEHQDIGSWIEKILGVCRRNVAQASSPALAGLRINSLQAGMPALRARIPISPTDS